MNSKIYDDDRYIDWKEGLCYLPTTKINISSEVENLEIPTLREKHRLALGITVAEYEATRNFFGYSEEEFISDWLDSQLF